MVQVNIQAFVRSDSTYPVSTRQARNHGEQCPLCWRHLPEAPDLECVHIRENEEPHIHLQERLQAARSQHVFLFFGKGVP